MEQIESTGIFTILCLYWWIRWFSRSPSICAYLMFLLCKMIHPYTNFSRNTAYLFPPVRTIGFKSNLCYLCKFSYYLASKQCYFSSITQISIYYVLFPDFCKKSLASDVMQILNYPGLYTMLRESLIKMGKM